MSNFRIYNDTLCPDLWDEYQHLDPRVRVNLLRMAYDFYKKTKLPAPIADIYLMGSIANYNWTPDSDADVHLMIDYNKLQMPPETAFKTVKTVGAQWNSEHNVTVKGHKVEMNLQNVSEVKPHVTGIYSLVKDQWVRQPAMNPPQVDKTVIQTQYKAMKNYIDSALNSGDRETMKSAKEYLDAYRQYGLDTAGEMSYENIVFKILRSKGILLQLKNSITATYDQEMTVKEVGMKDLKQTLPRRPSQYKYQDDGDLRLDKMTLDNLAALRAKVIRGIQYHRQHPEENPQQMDRELKEFARITTEIKRRLAYINRQVTEGFGAGIPEDDRLHIPGERWRIRSKDAPKTPKLSEKEVVPVPMNEDIGGHERMPEPENPLKKMFAQMFQPQRISFDEPKDPLDGADPTIKKIIRMAEKILDKKSQTTKFFTTDQVLELMEDIMASEIPNLPRNHPAYETIVRVSVLYLARDYDIRFPATGQRLMMESPEMKTLKKGRRQLSDEERQIVMDADATWHHGPKGEKTPAVWKSVVKGKTWYVCNTHSAMQVKPTLKGAIAAFKFIKTTA